MCAMKIKTGQELLTNKRKEVGKEKKNSCKQATEVPPWRGGRKAFSSLSSYKQGDVHKSIKSLN